MKYYGEESRLQPSGITAPGHKTQPSGRKSRRCVCVWRGGGGGGSEGDSGERWGSRGRDGEESNG